MLQTGGSVRTVSSKTAQNENELGSRPIGGSEGGGPGLRVGGRFVAFIEEGRWIPFWSRAVGGILAEI